MTERTFRINGRVVQAGTRRGIPKLNVEAWDADQLFDDFVGNAHTDEDGSFLIEFAERHYRECFGDRRPDLYFRVYRDAELIGSTERSVLWNVATPEIQVVIKVHLPEQPPVPEPPELDKQEVVQLDGLAEQSFSELQAKSEVLAASLQARLEQRARRMAIARLGGLSEALQKLLPTLRLRIDRSPEKTTLRRAAVAALRKAVNEDPALATDEAIAKELDDLERTATAPTKPGTKADSTLAESLRLNDPIAFHPEFKKELDAARLYKLSDATGLGDNTAEVLIKEVGRPGDISEARLQALVKDKKLKAEEAEAVGFAASLYNILDERTELVGAVKAGVGNVRELVKLDKQAWTKLIKDSKVKTPGRIAVDAYAELLEGKVKRLFPTDALSEGLSKVRSKEALKRNSELDALRKLNPNVKLVARKDFSALNTEGLSAAEVDKLQAAFRETAAVANRFSGMRVADVLENSALSEAQRASEVERRVGMATKFFVDNQDVLGADLTPGSTETKALKFIAGATAQDKAMVLATARTYQER